MVNTLVKARLKIAAGGLAVPVGNHVIVVGLGNIGARVVQELHDQGIDVVAVDPPRPPAACSRPGPRHPGDHRRRPDPETLRPAR